MNIIDLYNSFRDYHFVGNDIDKYLIERVEKYLISTLKVSSEKLNELNRQILKYMEDHSQNEYSQFLNYLIRSKLVKSLHKKLPIEELKDKLSIELEKLNKVINEMEEK